MVTEEKSRIYTKNQRESVKSKKRSRIWDFHEELVFRKKNSRCQETCKRSTGWMRAICIFDYPCHSLPREYGGRQQKKLLQWEWKFPSHTKFIYF